MSLGQGEGKTDGVQVGNIAVVLLRDPVVLDNDDHNRSQSEGQGSDGSRVGYREVGLGDSVGNGSPRSNGGQ